MEKTYALLALMRTPELKPSTLSHFLVSQETETFESPFSSSLHCVLTQTQPDWQRVDQDYQWLMATSNRQLITIADAAYPDMLRHIANAPPILLTEGNVSLLQARQLAIVGSRNPSQYGIRLAQTFARALSIQDITITSGLALGIDGAAHRGAIAGSGHTIAVLGTGLDVAYPKSHRTLSDAIVAAGGLLVSEFPLGTHPVSWHFPKRNRIISGLSQGVLVVEATLGSGSLKTAEYALQQGREVFAIPGSIHSPLSRGCHALIQQGAKLVNELGDILSELPHLCSSPLQSPVTSPVHPPASLEIPPLLQYIGYERTTINNLLQDTGLEIGRLSADLLELELQGYIAGVPGGYIRVA